MNPYIKKMNDQWQADAIEKCRNDPLFKELNLCPVCVVGLPNCLCVRDAANAPGPATVFTPPLAYDSKLWTG